ncbi:MAG TPA: DUF2007 domain-containing protein [Ignavibacteria bacterium]|nr:DUF2007 domain-containing protein [Ignavibacteria bacterium]
MNKEQQEKEDHENLVNVYATGNEAVVSVVKSILDEAGIRYLAQGEGVQDLFGVGVLGTGFNPITGPVIFKVMPEDEAYAKELLKDVTDN